MAQSTLDDDELFDEASEEMRADVQDALERTRDALPDADSILDVEGDNIIGVLNGLNSGLDAGDAEDAFREAKKWYNIGKKAEAFDDEFTKETDDEIEELEEALTALGDAEESASELREAVASLKSTL